MSEYGDRAMPLEHRQPLVSCIMPTYNRRQFVPQAISYFQRQDYPNKELIVVDDGTDPVADLVPYTVDPRIHYSRLAQRRTVGAKRNLACAQARGAIIAHWDDDDWHAPHRLSYQVEALLGADADMCGIRTLLFFDAARGQAWQYAYPEGERPWLSGSSLCYTRSFWEATRFADVDVAEDARFVWAGRPERMVVLADNTFHVGMIHPDNVSAKRTEEPYWSPIPVDRIQRLVGHTFSTSNHGRLLGHTASCSNREGRVPFFAVARASDLELPEFRAFNQHQALPRMRRWELPFALFQARMPTTGVVLDCSINPILLQDRLARLYPHVLYRHYSPIQNGQFQLPLVPDAAFERVVCVNTLEHLLGAQREALIAAMARALKPEGVLVVTSDYYFDSAWDQSAFLAAGVMRSDRAEIFNGWNRVEPADVVEMCGANGLQPLDTPVEPPRQPDPDLYLNEPPYVHACIGGVFARAGRKPPPPKKVVLSLLVWNTREISLDSARAHLREARLLRRLGHEPVLCICDNGSTDGTPEALHALEQE